MRRRVDRRVDGGPSKRRSAAAHCDPTPIGKPVPDVGFGAHYGLRSDTAPCPKGARCGQMADGTVLPLIARDTFAGVAA
jgi:hypothetical protein